MKQFNLTKAFDDSVFSIIGYTVNAMKQCKFTKAEIAQYEKDAMSDDYNYLLSASADMIDKCNSKLNNTLDMNEIRDELESWFWDNCNEDGYDNRRQWKEHLNAMINHANDFIVEDALDFLRNSFDEDAVDDARDEIENILADLADDMLNG